MNSNLLRVVCLSVLSLTLVSAQSPQDDVKVRFRTLGWRVAPDDLYYEFQGGDSKVTITESMRSVFHDVPRGTQKIVFYRLLPGPKDKPRREVAATVDIASAGPWPLLIFMANPEVPKNYRVAAIADDLKAFPFPSCRFVNLTAMDLYAKYGDQQLKIPAKGIERVDPHLQPPVANESQTRYTTVSMNTPNGPRLLYSNNWVVRPTQRTLVFVFTHENLFQVMRISDGSALYAPRQPKR